VADRFFLSYSSVDGERFALRLVDPLTVGPPPFSVWFDKRELHAGMDWDAQLVEAIRRCRAVLFVMTRDSVLDSSVCKREWVRALKYKKPIIPLLFDPDAELPFQLEPRQYIDFTGSFEEGLAGLRQHLTWMDSPEGILQALAERLQDAERELPRAREPSQQARIQREIEELRRQIGEQQGLLNDPRAARQRTERRITSGLEREREPERPIAVRRAKFVNPPPMVAPTWFQDRHVETGQVGDFLRDDGLRVLTVVGRGGVGKTAMVCRLLKALEDDQLPDDLGPLEADGIVYLSPVGAHKVSFPNLFADLTRLLPEDTARRLDQLYQDPQQTTTDQTLALLEVFPAGRTVLLLDNFEDVVDPETLAVADAELDEALRTVLTAPGHGVKVILTTRVAPPSLLLAEPGRQRRLNLDEGLPSPYAERILQAMDHDGTLGLKTASDALLAAARERTRGYPRALEALVAILNADRDTSLSELLAETGMLLPKNVVEALVGEAFNRLDPLAQQVMQALAIYGLTIYSLPVPPVAVDYLLQPYLVAVDSAPVLSRLVNMQFVRRDAGRYYLHQVDREYALSRLPQGRPGDREAIERPFTRHALLARGAEYFQQTRTPRESWKQLDDLAPQLAEFELRCQGEDYDNAASVLLGIDFDYLLLWGHHRLMVELHQRLHGKLTDPDFEQVSTGNLGSALQAMGWYWEAVARYEEALRLARLREDRQGEGAWLGSLGNCYTRVGELRRAVDFHEQALAIAREVGDRQGEETHLGNLGGCYASLGELRRAVDLYEQALAIDREVGDRQGEGIDLGNLGDCYASLGELRRAIDLYEQALAIAREIGDRQTEAIDLANLGECRADLEQWQQALKHYDEAIQLADQIGAVQAQSLARSGLAKVHLLRGDPSTARAVAEAACIYDYPTNNADVSAILGVALLGQGKREQARGAFIKAVSQADALLVHTSDNYRVLDTKALALCGLVLLGEAHQLQEAISAARAARAANQDTGVIRRAIRLLDVLAVLDHTDMLVSVRTAAEAGNT
jgi:tetratricopeptide (TPR) repeat protein